MNYQRLSKLKIFIGPSILVLAEVYMLRLSWLKWPDLLIDYGRELYIPWQITQGKVLYVDINHLFGPLAHYFNALLFQIFGTGLSTLVYFNICLVTVLVFLIYDLFKSTFGDFIATIAGLYFIVIFAFSQYVGNANYNFICPYSHEITYGVFLFFLALFVFRKYLLNPDWLFAALIGFLIGLIYLTKVEIFIASFITFLTGFIFIFCKIKPPHFRKHLFNLILFFFIPITAFFIYFSFHMPLINALYSILASYKNIFMGAIITNIFYLRISGFDDPLTNIVLMCKQLGCYLSLLIFTIVISYLFNHFKNNVVKYGWILAVFALVFVIIFLGIVKINWLEIARPYPIFIIALLIVLIVQLTLKNRNKIFTLKFLPFALLTLYSFLLLSKIILNVHLYHYGFALAMPATLVVVVILMYFIPVFISRWGNKSVATGFMGIFIFLTLLVYFNLTTYIYEIKNYPVAGGRDRFLTFDPRVNNSGPVINETLKYIDKFMFKKDTFIVLPEGLMINYLTRRSNPSPYFEFTPHLLDAIGEEKILKTLALAHPSFIILSERCTTEYGARYFGKDYAFNLSTWITNNYEKMIQIGAVPMSGNGFGIIIAKKKE